MEVVLLLEQLHIGTTRSGCSPPACVLCAHTHTVFRCLNVSHRYFIVQYIVVMIMLFEHNLHSLHYVMQCCYNCSLH